jgi:hypothetical protein
VGEIPPKIEEYLEAIVATVRDIVGDRVLMRWSGASVTQRCRVRPRNWNGAERRGLRSGRMPLPPPPDDLDATRAAIAARELVATASGYLTADVAMNLDFESLAPFKQLLLQFFSPAPWTDQQAARLDALVTPHVTDGWWEHDLGGGITLRHGIRDGSYVLWVSGGAGAAPSIFDRIFDGPVVPEATPHPRKVKFVVGGTPAPGVWYRRGDEDAPDDPRVKRLFAEPDVTDVMVAGDFVTVGIGPRSPWEQRLEPLLALVEELFAQSGAAAAPPERTRQELMIEAGRSAAVAAPEELHLLDPDDPDHQARLLAALGAEDRNLRRIAVAVLGESSDAGPRAQAVRRGLEDRSLQVRRTALDAAADTGDEFFRPVFERALADLDPWMRWKAVRAIGDLGAEPSRSALESVAEDPEFRVRFEVGRVLHGEG